MILYHGSNEDILSIDLQKGLRFKDFGKGFYLTPDKTTAIRMAQKKARLFGGTPTLITYDLSEDALNSGLKVKIFPEKASVEWFLFVDANRDRNRQQPVLQLTNYKEGIYSPEQAAQLLQDKYLDQQYYFGTERALSFLHKTNSETV